MSHQSVITDFYEHSSIIEQMSTYPPTYPQLTFSLCANHSHEQLVYGYLLFRRSMEHTAKYLEGGHAPKTARATFFLTKTSRVFSVKRDDAIFQFSISAPDLSWATRWCGGDISLFHMQFLHAKLHSRVLGTFHPCWRLDCYRDHVHHAQCRTGQSSPRGTLRQRQSHRRVASRLSRRVGCLFPFFHVELHRLAGG